MPVSGGYTINHNEFYEGMIADGQLRNTISKVNSTAATIPFGRAVVRGDNEEDFKLPTSTSVVADLVGITVYELNRALPDGETGAPKEKDATLLTMGTIAVKAEVDVTAGDAVTVLLTSGNEGKFSNTGGITLPNATWTKSVTAGTITKIKINLGV